MKVPSQEWWHWWVVVLVPALCRTGSIGVSAIQWIKDDGFDGWVRLRDLDTIYKIISPGHGPAVSVGARITVHAIGVVADSGRLFWSTTAAGEEPFTFTAGVGNVIVGWDKGCLGMLLGEVRQLEIPAHEAYGSLGDDRWRIPPNSPLVLELRLLRLEGGEAGITAEVPELLKQYKRDL